MLHAAAAHQVIPRRRPADKRGMKGCRSLTDEEIPRVLEALGRGRAPARDQAFFMVGIKTGFRVSELLALRLADVYQNGCLVEQIYVARRFMKKKTEGRTVPFKNEQARAALKRWVDELLAAGATPDTFLFQSREGENRPLDRRSAWQILRRAFAACSMTGKLATHSMRKTFARVMLALLGGDLPALQLAMGHVEITSTTRYIQADLAKLNNAFEKL